MFFFNFVFSQELQNGNNSASLFVDGTFESYNASFSCEPMATTSSTIGNWLFEADDIPEVCILDGNAYIDRFCKLKRVTENDSIITNTRIRAFITGSVLNESNVLLFDCANLGNEVSYEGDLISKIVISIGNQSFSFLVPSDVSVSNWYPMELNYCPQAEIEEIIVSLEIENEIAFSSAVIGIDNFRFEKRRISCIETCPDCSSFELMPNQEYVISGWMNVAGNAPEYIDLPIITYEQEGNIEINFTDSPSITAIPSGEIIDGWQRITKKFKTPSAYNSNSIMEISLINLGVNNVFFDDIRIHPVNANLKSFVYDQQTQKLLAELDENNYATFYEYDKEGGLVRVKKETEKGVFTIQETRSSTKKNPVK